MNCTTHWNEGGGFNTHCQSSPPNKPVMKGVEEEDLDMGRRTWGTQRQWEGPLLLLLLL